MGRIVLYLMTLVMGILSTNAQQITGRIVDSETNEGIAYATIRIGETDLISNDDGYFTLSAKNNNDESSAHVSYMGYNPETFTVAQLKQDNNIVRLKPATYDIGGVYVSNVQPDPNEIMRLVNENLAENYKSTDYKSTVFIRGSTNFSPKKFEMKLKKATDLSKNEVREINQEIQQLISKSTNTSTKTYSDILVNTHKVANHYKLDVTKAIKLMDENRSSDYEELQKSSTELFYKVMDTTKFYRIKSGLIGSKDTISFSKEYNQNKKEQHNKEEKNNLKLLKSGIENIIKQSSFSNKKSFMSLTIDFVQDTDAYSYSYTEATYLADDLVFVIDFKPKKSRAKYSGRLYINEADYAIVRADYKLAEGKKPQGINLKLILGVKIEEGLNKGIVLYRKNPSTNSYYLQYSLHEKEQYFYLNRPIKFIELTDGRGKDKISYDIKIEGSNIDKTEYLNIAMQDISASDIETIQEQEFEYQILKKYDPNIWKSYHVIEPLEEMKRFEVTE